MMMEGTGEHAMIEARMEWKARVQFGRCRWRDTNGRCGIRDGQAMLKAVSLDDACWLSLSLSVSRNPNLSNAPSRPWPPLPPCGRCPAPALPPLLSPVFMLVLCWRHGRPILSSRLCWRGSTLAAKRVPSRLSPLATTFMAGVHQDYAKFFIVSTFSSS